MTTFFLGTIGTTEWLIILLIALILFGAGRLPEIGEGLGKGIRSFKKALTEDDKKAISSNEKPKSIPSDTDEK